MARLPYLVFLGVQARTSDFLRKDSELTKAFNVHFDRIGSVKKRLGYSRVGATVASGTTTSTSSSSSSISYTSSSSSSISYTSSSSSSSSVTIP